MSKPILCECSHTLSRHRPDTDGNPQACTICACPSLSAYWLGSEATPQELDSAAFDPEDDGLVWGQTGRW